MIRIFQTATLLIFMLAIGCKEEEAPAPAGLLDREVFAAVMLDAQLAEGIKAQFAHSKGKGRNLGQELYQDLLKKHNVSEEAFKNTYSYYENRPGLMEGIYEQVLDSLSKIEAQIKQDFTNESKSRRDSVDALEARPGAFKTSGARLMGLDSTQVYQAKKPL